MDLKSAIKALSKEARADLARSIRQNPDLYNAVCGVGGISESLNKGKLSGKITKVSIPLKNLEVQAVNGSGTKFTALTDDNGFYQMELVAGDYTVSVTFEGVTKTQNVKIEKGQTTTFNQDFE
jgi:hypothetical protein